MPTSRHWAISSKSSSPISCKLKRKEANKEVVRHLKDIILQWKSLQVFKNSFISDLVNQLSSLDASSEKQRADEPANKEMKSNEMMLETILKNETAKKLLELRLSSKELEETLRRRLKRVYGFKNGIGKMDCRVEKSKMEKTKEKLEELTVEHYKQLNKLNN